MGRQEGLYIITNPPYGQRIGSHDDLASLYDTLLSYYTQ